MCEARIMRFVRGWAWSLVWVLVGLFLRFQNLTEVLVGGRFYFVDADCYSRMTRAELVSRAPGTVVRHHSFENWPAGVESHATAPMDYLIVVGERCLRWVWPRTGPLARLGSERLDLAGALISPLLGVVGVVGIGLWARRVWNGGGGELGGGWIGVAYWAMSPPLVHATVFGRPDHQSLLVLLLAGALMTEVALWSGSNRRLALLGGALWGLALWVSLFEPLVFLVGTLVGGWLVLRRGWWGGERAWWGGALLGVLVVSWGIEGRGVELPDRSMWEALARWGGTIGELQRVWSVSRLWTWYGSLVWIWPAVVWIGSCGLEMRQRAVFRVLGVLGGGLLGLTVWQARWAPYAAVVLALTMPVGLAVFSRRRWGLRLLVALAVLVPLGADYWERWFPEPGVVEQRHLDRSERVNARLAADRMRSDEVTPFLAVWWLSPAIAYWSGQPSVAGSGHEGIGGIRDSARFFLSETPDQARTILEARRVFWVVASDPARAVQNAREVLGVEPMGKPMAEILWEPNLEWKWGLDGERNVASFRLLRVLPANAPEFGGGSLGR
jgi:hypothetical protein